MLKLAFANPVKKMWKLKLNKEIKDIKKKQMKILELNI